MLLPYAEIPATTPPTMRVTAGSSGGPKRSESRSAVGRAPIARMSRMIPPTPVAAPWNGATALGWLWLSILNTAAHPPPTDTAPAFSPGPRRSPGPRDGSRRSTALLCLYAQCSLHITPNMPNSAGVGSRPRRRRISSYSAGRSPTAAARSDGAIGGCTAMLSAPPPAAPPAGRDPQRERREDAKPVRAAHEILARALGVRHQAEHGAGRTGDPGDPVLGAVGVRRGRGSSGTRSAGAPPAPAARRDRPRTGPRRARSGSAGRLRAPAHT